MKTYVYRASNLKSIINLLAFNSEQKSISGAHEKVVSCDLFIISRECSSTLYVALARADRASNLKSTITFLDFKS